MSYSVSFPGGTVQYFFEKKIDSLPEIANGRRIIVVTDANVHALYGSLFHQFETIVLPAGEAYKNIESVSYITDQLIQRRADRKTVLVGIGGGVVTDITGFAAGIYMRGISFGFVPTTLLAMVDAAIGGKNGVNVGLHKNMLGTIRQPEFILFDTDFLGTLPDEEWSNGFAEVIKYGCIFDFDMFFELNDFTIDFFRREPLQTLDLIKRCVGWKNDIVLADEKEQGIRKTLNFGHTVGHAIETTQKVSHGYAVSIGMLIESMISTKLRARNGQQTTNQLKLENIIKGVLENYKLPTTISFDSEQVMSILEMDKKRNGNMIDFVILEGIGKAKVETIPFEAVHDTLIEYLHAGNR